VTENCRVVGDRLRDRFFARRLDRSPYCPPPSSNRQQGLPHLTVSFNAMNRRTFLKATGGTSLLGLAAGCLGGEEGEATETANPDATTSGTTTDGTTTESDETTEDGDQQDIDGEVGESPQALSVASRELYRTDGEVGLRATVENTGDEAFHYVEAEVTLQDDQGEVLYEFIDETEEEQIERLAPGDSWQFDVVFQEAQMAEVRTYTIDLEGYRADENEAFDGVVGEVDQQDPNLEITSHNLTRQQSTAFVSGTIRNVGDESIDSVEVSVTLYDDDNEELFDFDDTVEEEADVAKLPPGQAWSFRVTFEDADMKKVGRYVVSADSDLV
jgi:hypothetical protein